MIAVAVAAAVGGFAAGWLVEWARARHEMAQLVDVDAVRAAVVDQGELEAQLAEQTMRAARYHRMWRIAQQVARRQAELLAARWRQPIPVASDATVHAPKHLRSVVPLYGAARRRLGLGGRGVNGIDRCLLFVTSFIFTTALAPAFQGGLYMGWPW